MSDAANEINTGQMANNRLPVEIEPAELDPREHDPVHHPAHYTCHPSGVECLTIVQHMNFCLGNVIKYVWRADQKGNSIEDLRKAREYLNAEINRREVLAAQEAGK